MSASGAIRNLARLSLAVVGLISVPAFADPVISIQPPSSVVDPGQGFSLDVFISDVVDLFAYQFDLGFDPAVVSATGVGEGPFLASGGFTFFIPGFIDNTLGSITFIANTFLGPVPGVTGSGSLATVQFDALAQGTTPITLSNVILLDSNLDDILHIAIDGRVTVTAVTITPELSTCFLLGTGLLGLGAYRRLGKHEGRGRSCCGFRGARPSGRFRQITFFSLPDPSQSIGRTSPNFFLLKYGKPSSRARSSAG